MGGSPSSGPGPPLHAPAEKSIFNEKGNSLFLPQQRAEFAGVSGHGILYHIVHGQLVHIKRILVHNSLRLLPVVRPAKNELARLQRPPAADQEIAALHKFIEKGLVLRVILIYRKMRLDVLQQYKKNHPVWF